MDLENILFQKNIQFFHGILDKIFAYAYNASISE